VLSDRAEGWRAQLIQALALVEARIDFSDEADVPQDLLKPSLQIARVLEGEITSALADGGRGERLREGLIVAIAGPPNAGKSTLLNRIAKREVAIVSPYAGTTRDVIEVHLDLGGMPVTLLDTAGIRETSDPVEHEGVRRARERAGAADLVLWVMDASDSGSGNLADVKKDSPAVWIIRNKIDLIHGDRTTNEYVSQNIEKNELYSHTNKPLKSMVKKWLTDKNELEFSKNENEFNLSATTGEGFEPLLAGLARYSAAFLKGAEAALVTRSRHRHALEDTVAALRRALAVDVASSEDILAEELRTAAHALARLTGRVDVEDILDVIFRDFCIGK
jgi:tRNA modification GTPase